MRMSADYLGSLSTRKSRSSFASMASCPTRRTCFRTNSRSALHSIHAVSISQSNHHQERKYFDSGDYALSKAGKASEGGVTTIGSQHPLPENIPHLTSPGPNSGSNGTTNGTNGGSLPGATSGSPVKESSFLHRETSVDESSVDSVGHSPKSPEKDVGGVPSPANNGVPQRWQS